MGIVEAIHHERHAMNTQFVEPFPALETDVGQAVANGANAKIPMGLKQNGVPEILDEQ